MKRVLDGILHGMGFIAVVAVAFAIAWAGDVLTVDKDGTLKFAVSDQGKITVGATESYVNLVVQNDEIVAESDNKVDITADVLTVEGVRLENVNISANIESGGAGGLDTGAEAANAWYYVWVITNNTGTSTNGLLSTSSTSPTMPSGFTRKRRVGAVRNNGSSAFLQYKQENSYVCYLDGWVNNRILNGGQATSWTTVSGADYMPPISRRGYFMVQSYVTHNAVNTFFSVWVRKAGFVGTQSQIRCPLITYVANQTNTSIINATCDVDDNQAIEYYLSSVPSTSGGAYIDVLGYYDRI